MSSDGSVFEKANTNAQCCVQYSISKSEDGTNTRWPFVTGGQCYGGFKKTFQQWIDKASSFTNSDGICIEGWLYSKTGTLTKINKY